MAGSESENAEDASSVTAVLKRGAPAWWWLRENFRPPSIAAIAGVVVTAGGWIWHEHAALEELGEHQKGLATSAQVAELKSSLDAIRTALEDHGDRIARIERYLDGAHQIALEPPKRPRRRPPPPPSP